MSQFNLSISFPGQNLAPKQRDLYENLLRRLFETGAVHPQRIESPSVRKFLSKPGYILLTKKDATGYPISMVFRPDDFFPLEVP